MSRTGGPSTRRTVRYEPREGERATEAVMSALAAAGVDVEAQSSPLAYHLDPDALDRLVSGGIGPDEAAAVERVSLTLWGVTVTVAPGRVVVEP
jgi:hypothetical protein